jgi:hypothetical protein
MLNFAGGVAGGFLGGLGAVRITANALKDRWIESVKAEYEKDLEVLKNSLSLGSYVTQAQLDLEIEAYKELWGALSEVRNHSRSLLSSEKFVMVAKDGEERKYQAKAFIEAMKAFHGAHNTAVLITERFAPFYPREIRNACREVTEIDMVIVNFYAAVSDETFSKHWFVELEMKIGQVCSRVEQTEELIRTRLHEVRLIR